MVHKFDVPLIRIRIPQSAITCPSRGAVYACPFDRVDRRNRDRGAARQGGRGRLLTASSPRGRADGREPAHRVAGGPVGGGTGAGPAGTGSARWRSAGPRRSREGEHQPVFVRDSAIAQEKMSLAIRMEKQKEWHKSADVYQEVLEKYTTASSPSAGTQERHQPLHQRQHAGAAAGRQVAAGRPGRLPRPVRPKAAELVSKAGPDDLFSLHKAFDLYFVTESGKQRRHAADRRPPGEGRIRRGRVDRRPAARHAPQPARRAAGGAVPDGAGLSPGRQRRQGPRPCDRADARSSTRRSASSGART